MGLQCNFHSSKVSASLLRTKKEIITLMSLVSSLLLHFFRFTPYFSFRSYLHFGIRVPFQLIFACYLFTVLASAHAGLWKSDGGDLTENISLQVVYQLQCIKKVFECYKNLLWNICTKTSFLCVSPLFDRFISFRNK